MSKSGLTEFQEEMLEILAEECAEVIKEKSKIFRFGWDSISWYDTNKTHIDLLTEEIGDVLGMIELVKYSGIGLDQNKLDLAKQNKIDKVLNQVIGEKE